MSRIYDTRTWRETSARVRARDGNCILAILGECRGELHAHHVDPVSLEMSDPFNEDRCVTLCARHHPILEAVQRRARGWKHCPHQHRYPGARAECERRLNGDLADSSLRS